MSTDKIPQLKDFGDETMCVSVLFSWAASNTEGTIQLVFGPFENRDAAYQWAREMKRELLRSWPIRLADAHPDLAGTLRKEWGHDADEIPCLAPKDPAFAARMALIVIRGPAPRVRTPT